ncbi:hypothetical protein GCK32_006953 [Trichostrongylus colubriformis]|uniref:Uncharacterized protein n=1 Tax=Trichostrongylus colubriformis TaxID=6319 RepID=A0AAN8EQ70_TRICO
MNYSIGRSGSTKSGSKTHTEKSEKEQASSLSSNKPTKGKQIEGAESSSSASSELGVASDRARNDEITVQAFPPVAIQLREPVRSRVQASSKMNSHRSSAQRKTRSHESSRGGHFIIHKEVGDPDVVEEYPKKKSAPKSCASGKCHQK